MGRPSANEDVISGLIMALDGELAGTHFNKFEITSEEEDPFYIAKLNYYEQLSMQYSINAVEVTEGEVLSPVQSALNAIDYHVREFFRMSPTGILYLAICLDDEVSKENIKQLQYYSGGLLRQVGILTKTTAKHDDYQDACTGIVGVENGLFDEHQPLSVIMTYSGQLDEETKETLENLANDTLTLVTKDNSNVSVLVGCDLDPELEKHIGVFFNYGCIGTALGAISKAAVHESIAWVQKFPLGLKEPGFITGDLLKNVTMAQLDLINNNRYIFVRTHVGSADNYFNDSHTLDVPTSDYAYIENVRTIDKATRGVRANLLPYLNAPLYVDASTGNLRPTMVAFLETTAGRALENMEQAGELSGYKVEINPHQNVLATSTLEVIIKKVPVGVMRKVLIKIGYTTSIR